MRLNELKADKSSQKSTLRKGRGRSSGKGKTSGRGHGGQNSRSGGGVRPGFEGGQMPLYRIVPKRGFNNARFAKKYTEIKVSDLNKFESGAVVTASELLNKKIISKVNDGIVVLGNGDIDKDITVKASRFTKSAKEKIEAAGGKAEVI